MVGNAVRKNISMPPELIEVIKEYCKETGLSFSEFLRQAALEKLEKLSLISARIKTKAT